MSLDGGHAQDVPQPRPPARVIEISYVIGRPDHAFDGPPKHRGIDGAQPPSDWHRQQMLM